MLLNLDKIAFNQIVTEVQIIWDLEKIKSKKITLSPYFYKG